MTPARSTHAAPLVAANDNRPAAFDERLMSYMPGLRKYAFRLCENDRSRSDDLVHETMAFALEKWANFRGDPWVAKSGFFAWLRLNMLALWQASVRKITKRREVGVYDEAYDIGTSPTQAVVTETRALVEELLESRDGAMMVACAMGDTLKDTGSSFGVSQERVRQLISMRRRKLGRIPKYDSAVQYARRVPVPKLEC